jgi:glycerophosphoryl diester phosphodiesterase
MRNTLLLPAIILLILILAQLLPAQEMQSVGASSFLKNGVVAHRGAWKNDSLPQNSMASLTNAFRLGVEGVEFDVQMTADCVIVVNHDPIFNGLKVEETSYADLSHTTLENGELLPTFKSFLEAGMAQNKTRLYVELKPSVISKERSLLLAKKVVAEVLKSKAQAWVTYISFDYDILRHIVELDEAALTMYLNGDLDLPQLKAHGIWGVDYHHSILKREDSWVKKSRDLGVKVNVWTVNDSVTMDYFLARRVDFITTYEPEMLLRMVSEIRYGSEWQMVYADEFSYTGLVDTTRWSYDTKGNEYGWGNNESQWYTEANPKNVEVSNGTLKIIARKEPVSGKNYSSARLTTKNKGDWQYCKVEVRAKLPNGIGTWPAIWMLPTQNSYGGWPKSGEIDIMEHVGYDADSVHSTVHTEKYNHIKGTQVGKAIAVKTATSQFHVYTTEWDEKEIRSYVDGVLYFSFQKEEGGFEAWPFDQPFHLILNLAIGGGWGGKMGIDDTAFPHTLEIDYVRVFQKK